MYFIHVFFFLKKQQCKNLTVSWTREGYILVYHCAHSIGFLRIHFLKFSSLFPFLSPNLAIVYFSKKSEFFWFFFSHTDEQLYYHCQPVAWPNHKGLLLRSNNFIFRGFRILIVKAFLNYVAFFCNYMHTFIRYEKVLSKSTTLILENLWQGDYSSRTRGFSQLQINNNFSLTNHLLKFYTVPGNMNSDVTIISKRIHKIL